MATIDIRELRVELARRDLTQGELATRISTRPSTLSSWLRGVNPPPPQFRERVEEALGLHPGALLPLEQD